MEPPRWGTPSKGQRADAHLISNLWTHGTPVKQSEMQLRRALEARSNIQSLPFTGLPTHITPPSKLRKLIAKNPFERDLINRLHLPVLSPTMFAKVSSPVQESPGFKWNIDELARINPARIEEFPDHQVQSPDPELETKAQAAIDWFFKQNHMIPSPWDVKQKETKPSLDTPNRALDDLTSAQNFPKLKKDVWTQTVLSLPSDLPQNVEEVLKPFFTFIQEQSTDGDDININNSSLRRKLFFNNDECTDNDSVISLSPVKTTNSMKLSCSPPQSGMLVHGTPLNRLLRTKQNNKSSAIKSKSISPPDMSPIHIKNNALYEKIARSSRSAIRLDFEMDMSIDSVAEKSDNSNDTFLDENNVKCTEDNCEIIIVCNDKTNMCDPINMEELPRCMDSTDMNAVYCDAIFNDQGHNNNMDVKNKTKIESAMQESHRQSSTMFGMFDQQSISNSIQDTGYLTYSTNSTMHTVDSYSNISTNYKTRWNEQVTSKSKDNNTQLSWRENIGNVFSSTPSKYNKN